VGALALLSIGACEPTTTASLNCQSTTTTISLPEELEETSGVTVSLSQPDVFWTHNDDGSVLTAIDPDGEIISRIRIRPSLTDWEDIATSSCAGSKSCLYLADTGDNLERRSAGDISIRRLEEPDLTSADFRATPNQQIPEFDADVFPVRLPDGPRDIEALLVLPGEDIYVTTKGRNGPVAVYRYPPPLRPDIVTLELVQELSAGARVIPRQVTGGSVSPEGDILALRTYESLQFFEFVADTLVPIKDSHIDLRPLLEAQGEGIAIGPGGLLVLTSEAVGETPPQMNLMHCNLDAS
jgi:hypothetical protein